MQRLLAIAWLTWKAAFRFRLFLVLALLLVASVVTLPLLIKDDGTARGFTQILLTYTLSTITALLGLSTLWLSCGTLARDIEECQMQLVAVKPVARWQIWLGKWLGLVTLNAALLGLSGTCVYALLQWRATRLPPDQQTVLRNEVLVARGSAKEDSHDRDIDVRTAALWDERLKQNPGMIDLPAEQKKEARRQMREMVRSGYQVVPPGGYRPWRINLGLSRHFLRNQPLQLRVKFNTADNSKTGIYALWQVGVPEKTRLWRTETPMSLAPETFHEFEIPVDPSNPADIFDEDGILTILFVNPNQTALVFSLEEGLEVLYHEGGFGLNFARGLGIILCWMSLLAALGLASASFLSFPVAAFFSLGMLTMALSSGTLANVVSEGTIMSYNAESGAKGGSAVDILIVPLFRGALDVIHLATETATVPDWLAAVLPDWLLQPAQKLAPSPAQPFSPIAALSTGRSISWKQLGLAFAQNVIVLGGIIGLIGIFIFNRRELATAQGNQ